MFFNQQERSFTHRASHLSAAGLALFRCYHKLLEYCGYIGGDVD